MRFPPGANWAAALVVGLVVVGGAAVSVVPTFKTQIIGSNGGVTNPGVLSTVAPSGLLATINPLTQGGTPQPGATAAGGLTSNKLAAPPGLECAPGKNGGATDVGVSATNIQLATTLAESGNASSFLGDARYGMLAVLSQVNRSGGICGRQLSLQPVDDGFQAQDGETDIRNFINSGYFALAVVPSSEGLNAASTAGDIDRAGIPVVGTDGMLYSQYKDPWIWPVSTSTISTAHIAAIQAYKAGARTFGIVYDKHYHFGLEGEAAFKAAISRQPGAKLNADIGIDPGQQDYSSDVGNFISGTASQPGCAPCDFTFMLLEPNTAISWIKSDNSKNGYVFGSKETSGPQPLFVSSFGQACGARCNNMWVWTGFNADYPPFDSQQAVGDYVNAIKSVSGSADTANQFLEGSYVGMELLVKALRDVGPYVTRARLKQVLDGTTWDSHLADPLHWQAGNHFANTSMLGFTIQYSQGFNGFQFQTGPLKDPWPNLDHPN
ncbi:MAG TPA: ABC transporter substrate-binding protein [Candidatus Dormibacteraeota bacterium]|jgi:ABC-type branched-subunit amino acid transport system substrate-binding protein|nr:ABC transporter substrate-binding protein [Candidatus Dormibacteraeota bacterium]